MRVLACLACLGAAWSAAAQGLPSEPVSVAGGRIVLGAEVVGSIGPDDPGFFNYTDYEYNALRNVRFGVSTEVRASSRLQVLAELRVDHGTAVQPYALFVRVRPWPNRRFDLQAGRIPPTFGAFTRTAYAYDNILVGQPLAYQYLLSLRPDAIPASTNDLLRMRGRGWLSSFPVGNTAPGPGVPIVNTSRWDTGLQAHGVAGMVEWIGSLTVGSLSDPRVDDNNAGRQLAGRLVMRPTPAWRLGLSAARGAWLDRRLEAALTEGSRLAGDAMQAAVAADAEYSGGPIVVRGEVLRSAWTIPQIAAPFIDQPLVAVASLIEGRYRVAPGVYVAGRVERIAFSEVTGTARTAGWEADVRRVEAGAGYSLTRNVLLKGSWQKDLRNGGLVRHDTLVSVQLVYWF